MLTVKGSRLTGSFDPQNLETALNSKAADGLACRRSTWKSMSADVMVTLERDRPVERSPRTRVGAP